MWKAVHLCEGTLQRVEKCAGSCLSRYWGKDAIDLKWAASEYHIRKAKMRSVQVHVGQMCKGMRYNPFLLFATSHEIRTRQDLLEGLDVKHIFGLHLRQCTRSLEVALIWKTEAEIDYESRTCDLCC